MKGLCGFEIESFNGKFIFYSLHPQYEAFFCLLRKKSWWKQSICNPINIELTLFSLSTNGGIFFKDARELKCKAFRKIYIIFPPPQMCHFAVHIKKFFGERCLYPISYPMYIYWINIIQLKYKQHDIIRRCNGIEIWSFCRKQFFLSPPPLQKSVINKFSIQKLLLIC